MFFSSYCRFSKQNFLSEVTNPFSLPDHSPSFKEYTGSKNNRFLSPAQASKNRIQPPSKVCMNYLRKIENQNFLQELFSKKILESLPQDSALFQHTTEFIGRTVDEYIYIKRCSAHRCSHVPPQNRPIIIWSN